MVLQVQPGDILRAIAVEKGPDVAEDLGEHYPISVDLCPPVMGHNRGFAWQDCGRASS